MRPLRRDEIVDHVTYEDVREMLRAKILTEKAPRRVHVGNVLTFLFETTDTVRYQVQEMMRVERMVRESDIQHEIDTYNEILGGPGELGCTLLIEIDDPDERARKLADWISLPDHLYVKLEDGTLVRPRYDPRQIGRGRLSTVQYLKFDTHGRVPVAMGADHPLLTAETPLEDKTREALEQDLAG